MMSATSRSGLSLQIAIIEDNYDLCDTLEEVLLSDGHQVAAFQCAEDLDAAPKTSHFDLILLDLNLPGEDGLSLAERLKRTQPSLRVIMMTTRSALNERVRGYEAGADLYLPKPINEMELLAAVRAMSRQIQSDAYKAANGIQALLRLDTKAMILRGTKGEVQLNTVEVSLLSALARAPGQQLEHWQLIEATGTPLDEAGKPNLAVRITRLRTKLLQIGSTGDALKSLRMEGYKLCTQLLIE